MRAYTTAGSFRPLERARDHHLGRLHDRDSIFPSPKLQRPNRISRDDRGERLVAYSEADLGEEAVHANLVDESPQAIPRAQSPQRLVVGRSGHTLAWRRLLTCEQPF